MCSLALVVLIDVDEAVALLHLAGAGGDEVDGARGAVADEVDAVFIDGFFALFRTPISDLFSARV